MMVKNGVGAACAGRFGILGVDVVEERDADVVQQEKKQQYSEEEVIVEPGGEECFVEFVHLDWRLEI